MNEEQFKGQYNILKGKIKEKWGRLTDDELTQVNGRRDQLLGFIQKKYGIAKERAEQDLTTFLDTFDKSSSRDMKSNTSKDMKSNSYNANAKNPGNKPMDDKGPSGSNPERQKAGRH